MSRHYLWRWQTGTLPHQPDRPLPALSPTSVYSDLWTFPILRDERWLAVEVFERIYTAKNRVVFQTCIEAEGTPLGPDFCDR
jgi:hypothetical protein